MAWIKLDKSIMTGIVPDGWGLGAWGDDPWGDPTGEWTKLTKTTVTWSKLDKGTYSWVKLTKEVG